uniref:Uncharacterized protein n=1 Tax=Arundo donax TaxID=35708 RepID=A0A0A8YHF3_ARUDO
MQRETISHSTRNTNLTIFDFCYYLNKVQAEFCPSKQPSWQASAQTHLFTLHRHLIPNFLKTLEHYFSVLSYISFRDQLVLKIPPLS